MGGLFHVPHARLVHLPVHPERVAVVELHAVHPDVPLACIGVIGKHQRQSEERAAVLRPTGEDRELGEVYLVALQHDLLARTAADRLRDRSLELLECPDCQLQGITGRFGNWRRQQRGNPLGVLLEVSDPQSHAHALSRAHRVDRNRETEPLALPQRSLQRRLAQHGAAGVRRAKPMRRSGDILEQERRAA
ncbi:MAG: hypothetical protein CNCCGFBP_02127 [Fimbriimonadaceae bacterium]|nr:hypothetical protein [Fimbriimonadaceae bacterium]